MEVFLAIMHMPESCHFWQLLECAIPEISKTGHFPEMPHLATFRMCTIANFYKLIVIASQSYQHWNL